MASVGRSPSLIAWRTTEPSLRVGVSVRVRDRSHLARDRLDRLALVIVTVRVRVRAKAPTWRTIGWIDLPSTSLSCSTTNLSPLAAASAAAAMASAAAALVACLG